MPVLQRDPVCSADMKRSVSDDDLRDDDDRGKRHRGGGGGGFRTEIRMLVPSRVCAAFLAFSLLLSFFATYRYVFIVNVHTVTPSHNSAPCGVKLMSDVCSMVLSQQWVLDQTSSITCLPVISLYYNVQLLS